MKKILFIIFSLAFCMMLISCGTSKPQINRSNETFDSIITVYDTRKVDSLSKVVDGLIKENYQLMETISLKEKTEINEKTTTERFDTLGNITERIVNERLTTEIKELNSKLEITKFILSYQKSTIDSLSKMNEKLTQDIILKTKTEDKSILIKKEVPKWCWWLMGINALIICLIGIKYYVKWQTKI